MPHEPPRSSVGSRPIVRLAVGIVAVAGAAALVAALRGGRGSAPPSEEEASTHAASSAAVPTMATLPRAASAPGAAEDGGASRSGASAVLATLGWGSGSGRIGKPDEDEGQGETPLRLATDGAGGVVLLDGENDRLVRLGPDGKPGADVRLPIKDARDVGVSGDGTLLLLDAQPQRARVLLLGPDGKTRGSLPVPAGAARSSRSVVTSGNDVFVEAYDGSLTRIGTAGGAIDPSPSPAPGRPMRDGRGYLTALIPDPEQGRVHVYVVDRATEQQRWSRLLAPSIVVEGIFLVDTSAAGTIYLGITGSAPGDPTERTAAQLLCLEPQRGEAVGAVALPVNVGEEAILDAKALDGGGVVLSIFTKHGVRVERHDCRE